ncbi:Cell division cycle 7-related protein kinase [Halotydeus destructor]|nr:Cell division cycle 7-related protein kinase [Halotydeus destructor]
MNSSKIVINCSQQFSSLRIEDPKRSPGIDADSTHSTQRFLMNAVPEINKHFILDGKIGEGTFSKVFKGRLIRDRSKEFALKYVIPTIRPGRIVSEIRYLRDLGGDSNVIGVLAAVMHHGHTIIIMPNFPHDKYTDYVTELTVEEIQDYMKNLLIALAKVHSKGVIHRDVKPSNFLYNRNARTYALVDFGLAQNEKDLIRHSKTSAVASVYSSTKATPSQQKPAFNVLEKAETKTLKITQTRAVAKRRISHDGAKDKKRQRLDDSTKASIFNTPMTPANNKIKCNDENSVVFKTPTKSVRANKDRETIPETPTRSATIVPETPPKTTEAPNLTNRLPKVNLFSANVVDTPKSRLQDKQYFSELKCNCFGRAQVCKICTKKVEICAPRAGTPGFRAPEVLLKSLEQTTAIDIWSAGVMFASLLSGRYPFFRNNDDLTSLAEIITVFGSKRVSKVAKLLRRYITIPEDRKPQNLKTLCQALRPDSKLDMPDSAYDLLDRLLDPNPWTRARAEHAVKHEFFSHKVEQNEHLPESN